MLQKYKLLLVCLAMAGLCSCKKYLEVQPQGAYTDEQVYANAAAVQQALNGLYLAMADSSLYGQFLTTTVVETMAQRYMPSPVTATIRLVQAFQTYQYSDIYAQGMIDDMWKKAYGTILAANVFIKKANDAINNNVVSKQQGQQLIGEALAIRAMMHFDLLRLFGPVFSLNPNTPSIPYYTEGDGVMQPLLSSSEVIQKVLADFTTATAMLATDPVITKGILNNSNFYEGFRNQRMNYYAVKGLMARAYLWAGQQQKAHDLALEVISEGEKWFPWTDPQTIQTLQDNPDRIFSSEVLLSVYNPGMYVSYFAWFSPGLGDQMVLTSEPNRLAETYESITNDYRYNENTWRNTTLTRKTFYKFADVVDPLKPFRFLQPLLRKSEMYYILAETETNPQQALTYLNRVRFNRNLVDLAPASNLPTEIQKEYRKEFWGEGQLFFYYKRNNVNSVPSGASQWSTVTPSYVIPMPLSETTPR